MAQRAISFECLGSVVLSAQAGWESQSREKNEN
jgi:hypothetical protein